MALGTSERLNMLERIRSACTQKEKLRMLNKAIEDDTTLNEEVNLRVYRVNLLCDMGDWEKALLDLHFIENIDMMTESLYFTQWKCMIYSSMAEIREKIVNKVYDKSIVSGRHITLLGRISEEKINELFDEIKAPSCQSQKRKGK